jgi:hypothetical protein
MVAGVATPVIGHRYEWENVVVWVENGEVIAASFSRHSGYEILRASEIVMSGTAVSVAYGSRDDQTHSFWPGSGSGSPMPAPVSLASVTDAARATFNSPGTWGGIDFPERNDNFETKLTKARPSWL